MNTFPEALRFLSSLETMGIKKVFLEEGIDLLSLSKRVHDCKRCRLSLTRTNVVFGEGNWNAELMFVGEAPGEEEDREGRPFVGKAGRLLTQLIEDVGLRRSEVYICNVLKCRPPDNRDPEKDEIEQCREYLFLQIAFVRPKVLVTLGRYAYNTIFDCEERITKVRGELRDFCGIKVIPTYHPSFLLRNPDKIEEVKEDIKRAKALLLSGKLDFTLQSLSYLVWPKDSDKTG